MRQIQSPLSHIVRRDHIPDDGLTIKLVADIAACATLAESLDIPAIHSMAAVLDIERWQRDGLVVRGHLTAELVQTCVVSLEQFETTVDEQFEEYLAPDPAAAAARAGMNPSVDDIEPLEGQRVDVGALAVEHLILGLDPHPRRPGVAVEPIHVDEEEAAAGPFAALDALRKSRAEN